MLAVADTLLSARCHNTADEAEEVQSSADAHAQWNNDLVTMGTTTAGVAAVLAARLAGAIGIESEPASDGTMDADNRAASLWRNRALWRGHWELAPGRIRAAKEVAATASRFSIQCRGVRACRHSIPTTGRAFYSAVAHRAELVPLCRHCLPTAEEGRGGGAGAALSDGGTAAQRGGATRGAPRVSGVAIGRANALCCLPEFCRG